MARTSQYVGNVKSFEWPVLLISRLPRENSRTDNQAFLNRHLNGRIDAVRGARADRYCEARFDRETEVVSRPNGHERGRLLEPEWRGNRADLVIGRVEVTRRHPGHNRAPAEIDHTIVRPLLHRMADCNFADALTVDYNGRA